MSVKGLAMYANPFCIGGNLMDKDKVTTVLGAVGAAVTAAQPVMNGVAGSLHTQDYFQLVFAVIMAVFGFYTNK